MPRYLELIAPHVTRHRSACILLFFPRFPSPFPLHLIFLLFLFCPSYRVNLPRTSMKKYRKGSSKPTIMNCLYFCDVFVFLHGCFMFLWADENIHRCICSEKHVKLSPIIFSFIILLPSTIKWAIKCDSFQRELPLLKWRWEEAWLAKLSRRQFQRATRRKSLPPHNNGMAQNRKNLII